MKDKIMRINQIAKERPQEVFTSMYHLINKELLKECFDELDGSKAVGIDKITKDEYRYNLDINLDKLVERLKNKSYITVEKIYKFHSCLFSFLIHRPSVCSKYFTYLSMTKSLAL